MCDCRKIIYFFIDKKTGSKWLSDLLEITQVVKLAFFLIFYTHIYKVKYKMAVYTIKLWNWSHGRVQILKNTASLMEFYKIGLAIR